MFNLWSFDDIDAIWASGLGGGSLIYANFLLRKDEDRFVREQAGHGYTDPLPADRLRARSSRPSAARKAPGHLW